MYPELGIGLLGTWTPRGMFKASLRSGKTAQESSLWRFAKIRGTLLGIPIIRIIALRGLHWGHLLHGSYHTRLHSTLEAPMSHVLRLVADPKKTKLPQGSMHPMSTCSRKHRYEFYPNPMCSSTADYCRGN